MLANEKCECIFIYPFYIFRVSLYLYVREQVLKRFVLSYTTKTRIDCSLERKLHNSPENSDQKHKKEYKNNSHTMHNYNLHSLTGLETMAIKQGQHQVFTFTRCLLLHVQEYMRGVNATLCVIYLLEIKKRKTQQCHIGNLCNHQPFTTTSLSILDIRMKNKKHMLFFLQPLTKY